MVLKMRHNSENYTEAVVRCKPEKLETMKEKMIKEYRKLGSIEVVDKTQENDNKGDD